MVAGVHWLRKAPQRIALAAVLAVGNGTVVSPAHAQRGIDPTRGIDAVMMLGGSKLYLSRKEMVALGDLKNTLGPGSLHLRDRALAEARRVAKGRDARYVLALYQLEIGRQRKESVLRAEALDILIASELTSRDKLAGYLSERGGMAYQLRDFKTARTLWTRLLEMKPNDPDTLGNLAQSYQAENNPSRAADLLERAAAAREAAGGVPTEVLYRQRLSIANQGKLVKPAIAAAHSLVRTYPNARNWRDALLVYRQLVAPTGAFEIDLLRLMRATATLARADEYQRMAQLLKRAGLSVEAKAVLGEGLARGLVNAGESPTREIIAEVERAMSKQGMATAASTAAARGKEDSLLAIGRHAEAALLYRNALAAPGANVAQVNTRLGMALLLAGRRAEAEAAFRAAANDPAGSAQPARYADLAQFWLAWLSPPTGVPSGPSAQTPADAGPDDGMAPPAAQDQAAGKIVVEGRRTRAAVDDEVVCKVVQATRSRLAAGKACLTRAEWQLELQRQQQYAREVAEQEARRKPDQGRRN
jgi:tetratricopeptide (TPR) repeat protein